MNIFLRFVLLFLVLALPAAAQNVAVVVPEKLQSALTPWLEHRRSQNYAVHLVVLPAGSTAAPIQIKERLQTSSMQTPLSAVLLVGNAIARNEKVADRVIASPRFASQMIQHFGNEDHFACDDWYADLNRDGVADFPVGRFPVESPEELSLLIQKTLRYETQIKPGRWERRIQLVAGLGNFDPVTDNVIESAAQYILTQTVPNSREFALVHADWKSPFCPDVRDFQTEFLETLNRGSLFWCYLGHGRHRHLDYLITPRGSLPMLDGERFPVLHCRDTLPIVLLFSCYGGTLDATTRSLAEEFVLQKDGPVAALAASRTTMPYGMSIFGLELLHVLFAEHPPEQRFTLGELVRAAKQRVLFPPEKTDGKAQGKTPRLRPVREMVDTLAKTFDPMPEQLAVQRAEQIALFNLFGDPLLGVPIPQTIALTVPTKAKAGQTVTVSGTVPKKDLKTVEIELVPAVGRISLRSTQREEFRLDDVVRKENNAEYRRSNETAVFSCVVPVADGSFAAEVPIPKNVFGVYVIRVFGCTAQDAALGSADITVR